MKRILMLTIHIILHKQTILKSLGLFENLAFVIMSTRENIRLIARASLTPMSMINFVLRVELSVFYNFGSRPH